ncbi:MAG: PQQ-binding-like beta-propeller repeat protein [Planctomycetaceae bacterium]
MSRITMYRNAVLCLTILLIPAFMSPWQVPGTTFGNTVQAQGLSQAELQSLGLEERWKSQAVMNVRRDTVTSVVNDEENVYVVSSSGMLTVFQAENGRKLWHVQVGRQDEATRAPVTNENVVVVLAGPVAYGFNKFTGVPLFKHRLPGNPTAEPALSESACYIPTDGGALNAYSLAVLEYQTRYGALPEGVAKINLWRFICGEEIRYAPVVADKAVSFATEANAFYTVETTGADRGRTRVQLVLTQPVTADLALADTKDGVNVLMLTGDDRIFSIEMLKGNTAWTYPLGSSMTQGPIVVGQNVFVATTGGALFKLDRDPGSITWGRPVQVPQYQSPLYIGAGMGPADENSPVVGPQILVVYPDSPAAVAGLQAGDILTTIDGVPVEDVESARDALKELPLDLPRFLTVNRNGDTVRLSLRIPAKEWDVRGVESLSSVGRFAVFATDTTKRLVAHDRDSGQILGRANVQGYNFPQQNTVTDQVYLASSSGDVVCLREIGPTVRVPELSFASRAAKVAKVHVNQGAGIDAAGTKVCDLELPDGTVQEITSDHAGVVRAVYVKEGQTVNIGDRLILIADDSFATYHRRPEQRPVDVELNP